MRITKSSPITLVELPPTQFGVLNGDSGHDTYTAFRMPSRAIHYLDGILKSHGWIDVCAINPIYHGIEGRLSSENMRRIFSSDVLLLSAITRTSPQSQALARLYKQVVPQGIVIAGGPDPTYRTEEWLSYVDIVVKREGEKTLPQLMQRLSEDSSSLNDILGIAFRKGKEFLETGDRELVREEEFRDIAHPHYDRAVAKRLNLVTVESQRGCPNNCDYCGVSAFFGGKYRLKPIDYVIAELQQTKEMGRFTFFSADDFIGNQKRAIELCNAIADEGLNKKLGAAQTTVKVAENPELMRALKRANIPVLCIGIESIFDDNLKAMGKPYSASQNLQAIRTLRDAGFWIHGMMMFGSDTDTPEKIEETSHWINTNLDSIQLAPITPLPITPFYRKMEAEGRILTKDWSIYDGLHVVVRSSKVSPYELQTRIDRMNVDFYSPTRMVKKLFTDKRSRKRVIGALGLMWQIYGKGLLAKMVNGPQHLQHLEFLKSVS